MVPCVHLMNRSSKQHVALCFFVPRLSDFIEDGLAQNTCRANTETIEVGDYVSGR